MATPFKKHLSASGLIDIVHRQFLKIADPRDNGKRMIIPLKDHLMSGLAVFGLKCSSLLDYDRKRGADYTGHNLHTLYKVERPPSDTYLRQRLDEVAPASIRPAFKKVFAAFQRGKGLEEYQYMNGCILISADGSGHFSSGKISCPHCCVKNHRGGKKSYYHQIFASCVVHPDKRNVIPLCPEVILNQDGSSKNDCERNACKRFLENFRREHPHLNVILLEDGLASTAPNIRMIRKHKMNYILGAKPGDHEFLFEQLDESDGSTSHEIITDDGHCHRFRFLNGASLNKSNQDVKVNVIEYQDTDSKGKEVNFSWVTNISLSVDNVLKIAKAGRARWKIENETFNTLKNLGYNLEHNYGHGKKYLSTNFAMLMMLAFLIDQVQEICCAVYRKCKEFAGTYRELWNHMRTLFRYLRFSDWNAFQLILAQTEQINSS